MELKQRITFFFLILLVLTGCQEKSTHIGPWLQAPSNAGLTILVGTKKEVKASLFLSTNASELTSVMNDSFKLRLHSYTVTGLDPGKKYYYQVRWPGGQTDTAYFKIAPDNDTSNVRILAYGDSRSNPAVHEQIVNQALEYNPDIALHTGDLVVNGKNLARWEPEFFAPAADLLQQIPIYPVLGNHERESGYYYEFFPLHENKHYWSADYGMVHIIGLNTGVATDPESEQYQWLEADLNANVDQQWTIVILHYPMFHVHPIRPVYEFRYHWQPLFEKYGVNLVFSGHDHYYLRNHPIGHGGSGKTPVTHITTAGGGAPLYKIKPQPFMAVSQSIHHFTMLEVSAEKIEGEAIDLDGNTIDKFSISKNGYLTDESKYIDFGIMELEQNLTNQLGNLEIVKLADSLLQFRADCSFGSELTFDSDLHIKWQESDHWQITNPDLEIDMQSGVDYPYEFEAAVPADSILPGPVVQFTVSPVSKPEVDDKPATIPENLTFEVSLENAMFTFAVAVIKSDTKPVINFINVFKNSAYTPWIMRNLAWSYSRTVNDSLHLLLADLEQSDPANVNLFYYAPFHFFNGDFNNWDKWLETVITTPVRSQVAIRPLFSKISTDTTLDIHTITDWTTIGPYDNPDGRGLKIVYDPETELNFDKVYLGKDGQEISWQEVKTPTGWVDFLELYDPDLNAVAYAHTILEANQNGRVLFLLGSDDAPALWLNGNELYRLPGGRGAAKNQDFIVANLKAGSNDILVKVDQGVGGWKLILEVVDMDQILRKK